jgi:hypothetical protein
VVACLAYFGVLGVDVVLDGLAGGGMGQRKQPQTRRGGRPRRRRRLTKILVGLGLVVAIFNPVINVGGLWQEFRADAKEHESRRAKVAKEDYDALRASVAAWDAAAMDAYDASDEVRRRTGRWPSARELGMHRPVYRAHAKVRSLQGIMTDPQLEKLLNALHDDIQALCAATSRRAAQQAAKAMVGHRGRVNGRIKQLRGSALTRLQMVG